MKGSEAGGDGTSKRQEPKEKQGGDAGRQAKKEKRNREEVEQAARQSRGAAGAFMGGSEEEAPQGQAAKQSKAKQSKAKQSRAEQSRAGGAGRAFMEAVKSVLPSPASRPPSATTRGALARRR